MVPHYTILASCEDTEDEEYRAALAVARQHARDLLKAQASACAKLNQVLTSGTREEQVRYVKRIFNSSNGLYHSGYTANRAGKNKFLGSTPEDEGCIQYSVDRYERNVGKTVAGPKRYHKKFQLGPLRGDSLWVIVMFARFLDSNYYRNMQVATRPSDALVRVAYRVFFRSGVSEFKNIQQGDCPCPTWTRAPSVIPFPLIAPKTA